MKLHYQINEAALTNLLKLLVSKFGSRYLNQDNEYKATVEDLQIIFDCINEVIFKNKLSKIDIEIVDMMPNDTGKAVFMFDATEHKFPPKIKYLREIDRDTPLFVTSALCHEMIHFYDYLFGPLSSIKTKSIEVKNGKQLVGEYDVHGDYFKKWMNDIVNNGIPTSIIHPGKIKVRYYMNNEELKEGESTLTLAERAKMFYDTIKTDDLFLVEVKDDHVYCVMQ